MIGIKCRFCGYEAIFKDGTCPVCFCVTPRRKGVHTDVNAHFTDYSYNRYSTPILSKIFSVWMRLQAWLFSSKGLLSRIINSIFSPIIGGKPKIRFSSKEYLADVGCGKGFFLKELPKGWIADGYDIVNYSSTENVHVHIGNFEVMDIKKKYSIVRSSHSLEHAQNPKVFLNKIVDITKNGGYIVLSSPNSLSFSYYIFGKFWVPYTVVSHFCILNLPAVSQYLEDRGCKILYKNTYTLFSSGGSLVDLLHIKKWKNVFFVLFNVLLFPIMIVEFILNRSDSFIIYAKKI